MTVITANVAFNQNNIDLSFIKSGLTSFDLLKGSDLDPRAAATQDSLVVYFSKDGHDFADMIVGKELTIISNVPNQMNLTAGQVYSFADFAFDGQGLVKTVAFEGFDVSAALLWKAIETTSTLDDSVLINKVLSGHDVFALSQFDDYANGYRGNDKLYGQDGDDTLLGDAGVDRLFGGGGMDSLVGGLGEDFLDGGLLNDIVFGGDGNDRLLNSLGEDTLTGGDGADVFAFGSKMGVDHITDFTSASDQITFSRKVFAGIGPVGPLAATAFYAGQGAVSGHLATDRVIYNTSTGVLYFDPDGSGSRSAVQIAILDGHPALAHSDVLIF